MSTNHWDTKKTTVRRFEESSLDRELDQELEISLLFEEEDSKAIPRSNSNLELTASPLTGQWSAVGPSPIIGGGVDNVVPNNEVSGAIETILAHPTNPDILYIGTVNGGIWRTSNATSINPTWEPLTDNLPSNSIGAMGFDPTDPTNQTIIVGIGRTGSLGRRGGPFTGLLLTTDGGESFTQIDDPLLRGRNFSGIAKRGNLILATAENLGGGIGGGLYRSSDNGATWSFVSGTNGLGPGEIFDLVSDPNDPNRFYVSVANVGIFRSDDGGLNWTNISVNDTSADGIQQAIVNAIDNNNIEMSVASNGRLYVGVIDQGQPNYIGYADDLGANWTTMDLPQTPESNGETVGISPKVKPGGQGAIHFSIVADPNDPNIVYVGGDRQDGPFPNFIGANAFTGRLFRGDTTIAATDQVPSPQWEHLTHSNQITQIPEGGTANNSAPHADSREMTFDANGNIIEVNDGGIYRRTNPQDNTGDWFSINGNLQVTEIHDIAYDTVSNIIISGNQDNGTTIQGTTGSTTWVTLTGGDGGDVAVDNVTLAAIDRSIRYLSFQFLGSGGVPGDGFFFRAIYDSNNNLIDADGVTPVTTDGTTPFFGNFITPMELNSISPTRLLIGGTNFVYESFDQGNTIRAIGEGIPNILQNAIVYGGSLNGTPNPDVVYYGSANQVYLRTDLNSKALPTSTPFPGDTVRDLILDPDDWRNAFVIDNDQVFQTTDAGKTNWTDITGDLSRDLSTGFDLDLRTIEYISSTTFSDLDAIVVGSNQGIFASISSDFSDWFELGTDLPNVPVWDLDYDPTDDILVAGTLGRGAWTFTTPAATLLNFDLVGTASSETVKGNRGNNAINGLDGDDTIFGRTGNDYLNGGIDNDKLRGNKGNDTLFGASGNDELRGGAGNDELRGGAGNDELRGGTGNDHLVAASGDDLLRGGSGDDILDGGSGNDRLFGNSGADQFILTPGQGTDTIVDYQDGQDVFGLVRGLSFSDLSISVKSGQTAISNQSTNEVLAYLNNVKVSSINADDFIVIGSATT